MVYWRKLINKCRSPHHGDSGLSCRRQYHAQPAQTKDPASYEVVADFDGNLEDDLLVLGAPTVNSWVLDPKTRRLVTIDTHGLSSIEKEGLNFWLKGPTILTIRIYGAFEPWTLGMIHVGESGSNLAELVPEVVDGEQRYTFVLMLDATNPDMNGIVKSELQTSPGIYAGWAPSIGQWLASRDSWTKVISSKI